MQPKELIKYKRKDGVELSATLYLPPGYKEATTPCRWSCGPTRASSARPGGRAGERLAVPLCAARVQWPLPFLTLGYAVLDNPTMPIVGEGRAEPNDTYLPPVDRQRRSGGG